MLNEDIYGNVATVFHRTSEENLIDSINKKGFKAGYGATYGKGFYATYDLESQLTANMESNYGKYVVKFGVNLSHFFFFDYSEFIKTPLFREHNKKYPQRPFNKLNFVNYQFFYYKMKVSASQRQEYQELVNDSKFTSDAAHRCTKEIKDFTLLCAGIVFTGRHDGLTLVAYRLGQVKPLSYVDAGESVRYYSVRTSIYGEVDKNDILEGSVNFDQYSYTVAGDDYDLDESVGSSFTIQKVGQGVDPFSNADLGFMTELETSDDRKFYTMRGKGIYIEYYDDFTPDNAQIRASSILQGEWEDDYDDSDFKRALVELLHTGTSEWGRVKGEYTQYDYLLIKNDFNLDDYLEDALGDFISTRKGENTTLYDSAGVEYRVYYIDEFDWETPDKYSGNDWVSTPAQRAYDHQLDLDFGL
jgi:hypothetical protein